MLEGIQEVLDGCVAFPQLLIVKPVADLRHGRAHVVSLERIQHKERGQRVNLKILLVINEIPDGPRSAIVFAFQRIIRHTSYDFFGEIGGVVFRITLQNGFQDNAF